VRFFRVFAAMEPALKTAALICAATSCLITACDSDLGLSGSTYTVGGTVSGLAGSDLVLHFVSGNTVTSTLTISSNGSFAFAPHLAKGAAYSVTIESQPVNPSQVCTVGNGSGSLNGSDVTNVIVNCGQTTRFAYVANKLSNSISAYALNSTTGALTPIAGSPFVSTGSQPDSVWVGPAGNFLYVADSASNDLGIFSINTETGLLTPQGTVPTGVAPYGIVTDPTGSYLYVSNYSSNSISAYAVDASSGALTQLSGSPFPVGVAPTSLTVSGEFLYVADYGSRSISVLRLDSTTGALSSISGSPFAAGVGPISIAIDSTGAFAYVANKAGATISEYSIDSSTGALTALAGSPLATQSSPTSLAIAGASVIVTDVTQADDVGTFAVAGTGVLSFSTMTQTGGSPVDLVIDPSGQFAYVVCEGTNNVFVYTVSGGTLTPAAPLSVAAGTGPVSIAIN
jgi:6-phosphogluconolactonase (cycloisomerase 2 family)